MKREVMLGIGVLGVGVLAVASSSGGRRTVRKALNEVQEAVEEVVEEGTGWLSRVVNRVSRHEGRHDSLNLNTDGAGLSFGILQWVQKSGSLGTLLQEMYRTDPARFAQIFGPAWQALLQGTMASSLDPVDGALLWQEPWVSRFRAAGRDPSFIEVQNRLAAGGDHMKGALQAAETLNLVTERSVALMYDTSVQQGPGFAKKLAERVRQQYAGQTVPMKTVLTTFAQLAPAHFRRTTAPTEPYPVSHIAWKQVGSSEWHAYAGKFDLYADILRRRMGIVEDPNLSDNPVTAA